MKTKSVVKSNSGFDGFEKLDNEMKVIIKGGNPASTNPCQPGGAINILCDNAGKKDVAPTS